MTNWKTVLIVVAVTLVCATAKSQVAQVPRLETNEVYVQDLTRESTLAISDPLSVFSFVLKSLPERVKVYPTENYYYFRARGTPGILGWTRAIATAEECNSLTTGTRRSG